MKESYLLNQVFVNEKAGKIVRLYGMEEMLMENAAEEVGKSRAYWAANTSSYSPPSCFSMGRPPLAWPLSMSRNARNLSI